VIFDEQRAADILADAYVFGDRQTAARWKVHEKTIRNYRQRLKTDAHFASLFRSKIQKEQQGWASVRLRFLRSSLGKLTELVEKATDVQHIGAVTTAIKIVGELQVAVDALGMDECSTDTEQGQQAETPSTQADNTDDQEGSPFEPLRLHSGHYATLVGAKTSDSDRGSVPPDCQR